MRALFAVNAALSIAIGGCATPGTVPTAVVTPIAPKVIPADRVKHAVLPGRSTRADVLQALGESLVIRFDSGYEVWVYRLDGGMYDTKRGLSFLSGLKAEPRAAGEFVILFAPSGVVAKTRIRPAPPPHAHSMDRSRTDSAAGHRQGVP
jgi:hypothetical protein